MPAAGVTAESVRNVTRGLRGRFWLLAAVLPVLLACAPGIGGAAETWRGLALAPEHRCSPYERKRDYPYQQSVEHQILRRLGAVYGPYTGTCFTSARETDIEHIVATSEAHDSGLCARDRATRARFASDLRNLTLAAPNVNRHEKRGKDAAEWMPDRNRCWFAARIVDVRRAYDLTIDRREAAALERVLSQCTSVDMEPLVCHAQQGAGRDSGAGITMGWRAMTTTATVESPAGRREGTVSLRCGGTIRRTGTCAMATATGWCASKRRAL